MKKKIITLAIATVMLITVTVGATIAWLTAESEEVTNTFTVGNIKILLNEADVNIEHKGSSDSITSIEYNEFVNDDSKVSEYKDAGRVPGNTYKLIPGSTYFKDPKVTILEGSEKCYVYVKVKVINNEFTFNFVDDNSDINTMVTTDIISAPINGTYWKYLWDTSDGGKLYLYSAPNSLTPVVDVSNYVDVTDEFGYEVYDPYLNKKTVMVDGVEKTGYVLPSVIANASISIHTEYDGVYKDDSEKIIENPEQEGLLPELKFEAYAIQAENFSDETEAWNSAAQDGWK